MAFDEVTLGQISDEVKADPSFAEISKGDLNSTVKNLIDSQKTMGRAILLPDEKDPDDKKVEKYNSIYEKLGRPKTHADYNLEEIFGEEHKDKGPELERYLKAFHEAGLSSRQAKRLVAEYAAEMGEKAVSKEKALELLSTGDPDNKVDGWGEKTPEMVGVAKQGLAKFDPDGELTAWLESSGVGNQPAVLRFLHRVGASFREDSPPKTTDRAGGAIDKTAAQSKVATIMNDRNHPYWDKAKAGHKEAIAEVYELNKIIHGTKVESVTGTH